jgi:hypothetical protein
MVDGQETDEAQSAGWLALRDVAYVDRLMPMLRLAVKLYFRSEVRGLESVPEAGALLVSNPAVLQRFWTLAKHG